jgi:hypothetical protein
MCLDQVRSAHVASRTATPAVRTGYRRTPLFAISRRSPVVRKSLIPLVAIASCAVAAPVVLAQSSGSNPSSTVLTTKVSVTPSKAGTKKKPQGVKLSFKVNWTTPEENDKPVTQTADVLFPKGSLYNGGKFATCSQATMERSGVSACPAKSIMGTGSGTAYADLVLATPKITVVNGGANKVYLFTVLTNPARVAEPVPGTITKMSGQWAYKLHLVVPSNLQVVAGVPIALRDLTINAGGKSYAKDWLATTSCGTGGKWAFQLTTAFDNGGNATYDGTTPCK